MRMNGKCNKDFIQDNFIYLLCLYPPFWQAGIIHNHTGNVGAPSHPPSFFCYSNIMYWHPYIAGSEGFRSARCPPGYIAFTHLTKANGLPSDRVRSMIQDHQGYIWITTDNGLARYDGKNIKVFRHQENDTSSLVDNALHGLKESRDSMLWIGAADGISIYNPDNSTFRSFSWYRKGKGHFPAKGSIFFFQDSDGSMWIGTENGLVHALKDLGSFEFFQTWTSEIKSEREYAFRHITCIMEDPRDPGKLLLATLGGVLQFDKKNKIVSRDYKRIINNASDIIEMYLDEFSRLWVCGWGNGLQCLDLKTERWHEFSFPSREPNSIVGITRKSKDELWLGIIDHGLGVFNMRTFSFSFITMNPGSSKSLLSNTTIKIRYFNHDKDIWISSDIGINILHSGNNTFRVVRIPYRNYSISTFFRDPESGLLYIGVIDGDGLYTYREQTGQWNVIPPEAGPGKYGFSINRIMKDSKNRI